MRTLWILLRLKYWLSENEHNLLMQFQLHISVIQSVILKLIDYTIVVVNLEKNQRANAWFEIQAEIMAAKWQI